MTLEEAIVHAEEKATSECGKCAEEHRQLACWLKKLQDYEKNMEETERHGWIPVSRRLPEQIGGESEEVLCLYATGDQRVGLTCEGNAWISAETGMEFLYEVIAWRPLPESHFKKCDPGMGEWGGENGQNKD